MGIQLSSSFCVMNKAIMGGGGVSLNFLHNSHAAVDRMNRPVKPNLYQNSLPRIRMYLLLALASIEIPRCHCHLLVGCKLEFSNFALINMTCLSSIEYHKSFFFFTFHGLKFLVIFNFLRFKFFFFFIFMTSNLLLFHFSWLKFFHSSYLSFL